jgi:ATP-dependent exoDNAse (exonuclease V) beta subunit
VTRSRRFPRLLRDPRTSETRAVLAAADIDGELKEAIDAQNRQELERLLYVALTRARHTLVIAHDHELFAGKNGLAKHAPARLLSASAAAFAAPLIEPSACATTSAEQSGRATDRAQEQFVIPLAPCPDRVAAAARERATFFIKRNPSALAEAALAEADPAAYLEMKARSAADSNLGSRYGTWWHEFVEQLDWRAAPEAWEIAFAAALESSPDAELSHREWALLREQLRADSTLARLLMPPTAVVHAELPFLWTMNERECLEGIIDLAIFDSAAGRWTILDWKTNRLAAGGLAQLQEHYLPQLSAYWHAVTAMLAAPVVAGLYSTATGAWLPYDTSALAAAWEKLRREPAALAQALDAP